MAPNRDDDSDIESFIDEHAGTRTKKRNNTDDILYRTAPANEENPQEHQLLGRDVPEPEPIPIGVFCVLLVFVMIPAALYIVLFTKMGWGIFVFHELSTHAKPWREVIGAMILFFVFTIYLFDVTHWQSWYGRFLRFLTSVALVCGVVMLILGFASDYPYGPIGLFAILATSWLIVLHKLFFSKTDTRTYISWLSKPLLTASLLLVIAWSYWYYELGDQTSEQARLIRLIEAKATGCEPDLTTFPECKRDYVDDFVCGKGTTMMPAFSNSPSHIPSGGPSNIPSTSTSPSVVTTPKTIGTKKDFENDVCFSVYGIYAITDANGTNAEIDTNEECKKKKIDISPTDLDSIEIISRWDILKWKELPPIVQKSYEDLGATKKNWNKREWTHDKSWSELSENEKVAAELLGFQNVTWESYDNITVWNDYCWDQLPPVIKEGQELLGFNEAIWNNDSFSSQQFHYWSLLSENQKDAAWRIKKLAADWDVFVFERTAIQGKDPNITLRLEFLSDDCKKSDKKSDDFVSRRKNIFERPTNSPSYSTIPSSNPSRSYIPSSNPSNRPSLTNISASSSPTEACKENRCKCKDNKCDEKVYSGCVNNFIIYDGPVLVASVYLFLGFISAFLRSNKSDNHELYAFAKVWLVLLFGVWVAGSLSGVNGSIATVFGFITVAAFIASGVMLMTVMKTDEMKELIDTTWDSLEESYGSYFDYARGLLVLMCMPILLLLVYASTLKQCFRKINLPCETGPVNRRDLVTEDTAYYLRGFYSWNRSTVYTYAIYFGIFYVAMNVVVGKFTTLFLAWLVDTIKDMSIFVVTGILVAVGLTMFLFPPIPGVPVYMIFGIVIIPVGSKPGSDDGWPLGVSFIYACVSCLILKLLACSMQQKAIGELLSKNVNIRQMVGMNSSLIRAMKVILQEPGLGMAKCAILTGGPDWPTSVLCGILRLPLIPILIGTLPVGPIIIAPTVAMGSLLYMKGVTDPNTGDKLFEWASEYLTWITLLTAVCQLGAMMMMAYYVEQAMSHRKDEIAAIPIDQEVLALDEKVEENAEEYDKVTAWHIVPEWAKLVLNLSLFTMTFSVYLFLSYGEQCFEAFEITDRIPEKLPGGAMTMVKPLGWYAIGLCVTSCFLLTVYTRWAGKIASEAVARKNR